MTEELMKALSEARQYCNTIVILDGTELISLKSEIKRLYEHFATLALKELEEQKQAYEIMDSACVKALNKWDKCKSRIANLEDIIKRARIYKEENGNQIDCADVMDSILSEV